MTNASSFEQSEPTLELAEAVDVVHETLATAANDERAHIVEELNEGLEDSGVKVIDVSTNPDIRRGVHSGLTRDEYLAVLAVNGYHGSRTIRSIGRRAL